MSRIDKQISEYIDQLNQEKMPAQHRKADSSSEMKELTETVRLLRSMREPSMPSSDFPVKVAEAVRRADAGTLKKMPVIRRRAWFSGVAAAAVILIMIALNFVLPFGGVNIVSAMENAYQDIKAYHGVIEVVETNALGSSTTQAKLEVWADRDGKYYVKQYEGYYKDLVTVNNGQKKWQVQPQIKQVNLLAAFPDPYRFTFEIGKEIEDAKNALATRIIGDEAVAGREASVVEVSPKGGLPYRLWIDKETKMPLQRQTAMQNALQVRVTYTELELTEALPVELLSYRIPEGFKETVLNPEQVVTTVEEASKAAGFVPQLPKRLPAGYVLESISVTEDTKAVKMSFASQKENKTQRAVILQGKATAGFKPASTAVLGKLDNVTVEIQSPVQSSSGILSGGGAYAGVTDIVSARWQDKGFEYAIVGNMSVDELSLFAEALAGSELRLPEIGAGDRQQKPEIEVQVDMKAEENSQKSVDGGSSPWRLDPAFVAQVFVSLKLSPDGIKGDYPVKYEELVVLKNDGKEAVLEVKSGKSSIKKVYLKRLVRQDSTGIWTVVGYDE